ncbi:MAG: sigma 54-interacting transcriptional regulator [Deltaproteobacteria bacterium]|nr:sigma 54-interacting transcriptional regulator [Deltaproteobacteria bacterium]
MPATRYTLRVELSDGQSFTHEIIKERTVLGRSSSVDVPLWDDGVSREHAALERVGDLLFVTDLGSTNGTRRNGRPISERTQVADGDRLAVGLALVTVLVNAAQAVDTRAVLPSDSPGVTTVPTTLALDEDLPSSSQGPTVRDERPALRALYLLGRALEPTADEDEILRRIVAVAEATFDAEQVVLIVRAPGGEKRIARPPHAMVAPWVEQRVVAEGRAVLAKSGERNVLCVPFRLRSQATGLLGLEAPVSRRLFQPIDLDLLTILAHTGCALMDNARLVAELRGARDGLARENQELRDELSATKPFLGILGESERHRETLRTLQRVAKTDATVLITGESGTGKELFARAIHATSPRQDGPFLAINCAAIPATRIDAELVGIERGVATGVDARSGKFEQAGAGTLFLDEIAELPLLMQAKLLRVLEDRQLQRVGGHKSIPLRARIVAATNRDLPAEVAAGRFRGDLFYRLNVVPIRLPPLRERPGDTALLAQAFLRERAAKQGVPLRGFSLEAMAALEAYSWPGNVRELAHEIERIVTVWEPVSGGDGETDLVLPCHLADTIQGGAWRHQPSAEPPYGELELGDIKTVVGTLVEHAERRLIRMALAKTKENRVRAAKLLGLTREGLRKKMIRYGMEPQ